MPVTQLRMVYVWQKRKLILQKHIYFLLDGSLFLHFSYIFPHLNLGVSPRDSISIFCFLIIWFKKYDAGCLVDSLYSEIILLHLWNLRKFIFYIPWNQPTIYVHVLLGLICLPGKKNFNLFCATGNGQNHKWSWFFTILKKIHHLFADIRCQ